MGFGTYRGSVIAGDSWGAPMREMGVPPARPDSLEDALHATAPPRALFVFPEDGPDLLTDEPAHREPATVDTREPETFPSGV